jgi:hypothetical protein
MRALLTTLLACSLLVPGAESLAENRPATTMPIDTPPPPPPGSPLPPGQIEIGKMLMEAQKVELHGNDLHMVLWMPNEFWASSLAQAGDNLEARYKKRMLETMGRYVVIAAIKGDPNPIVRGKFATEATLRELLRIVGAEGEVYAPLPPEQLDEDMRSLLEFYRPMLGKMSGEIGDNLHLMVFPARDRAGRPLADATANGRLRLRFGEVRFEYRLPLGSLLVPRRDPATGESFPGNYLYNPYTGARLEGVPATH